MSETILIKSVRKQQATRKHSPTERTYSEITMASELNESSIPSASPVMVESPVSLKPKRRVLKMASKPIEVAEPEVAEEDEKQPQEKMITIPLAEYERLLAIAEKAGEKTPKPKGRIATKDAVLRDMLRDGEKVFSPELVNTLSNKWGKEYTLQMRATFVAETNGFVVRADDEAWNTKQMAECEEEEITHNYKKRGHIASPTTLCSYFRFMMNHNGLSKQDKSTTCGFAKCYVVRDEKVKLSQLL